MLPKGYKTETVKTTLPKWKHPFWISPQSRHCEATIQKINSHPCKSMKWHSKLVCSHSFVCNRTFYSWFYVDLALFAGKWISHKWFLQPIVGGWLKIFKLLKGHKIAGDETPWNWLMVPGFALFGGNLVVLDNSWLWWTTLACFMMEVRVLWKKNTSLRLSSLLKCFLTDNGQLRLSDKFVRGHGVCLNEDNMANICTIAMPKTSGGEFHPNWKDKINITSSKINDKSVELWKRRWFNR